MKRTGSDPLTANGETHIHPGRSDVKLVDVDLKNRAVLVTGGKRIGAVVAVELARRGADVGLCYNRSREEAEKTAATIEELGRRTFIKQANLTKAADCEAFVNEGALALGRLDVPSTWRLCMSPSRSAS